MRPDAALPTAIFLITYFAIAVGGLPWFRLDRPGAALAGGVAMVLCGALSRHAALNAIDFSTLGLLFGMMIVVANLRISGAFAAAARAVFVRARSGFGLLAVTVVVSGVLAAFFINDVVCLTLTPLLIGVAHMLGAEPLPYLLALATASNIGSAATITGNPQNMIVSGFAQLSYLSFLSRLAPIAIIGLVIDYAVIAVVFRKSLGPLRLAPARTAGAAQRQTWPIVKSSAVALGVVVCFVLGFPTDLVALGAAVVLLFTRRIRPQQVYRMVDWTLLLMFAGLFVVVAGAQTTGILKAAIHAAGPARLKNPIGLTIAVAVLSNLVSNVPAVLLFKPLYPMLGGNGRAGLLLAGASTLAGNLTVLGSIANLIVIEAARRDGIEISFGAYLRVGVPITILTLVLMVAMLAWGV